MSKFPDCSDCSARYPSGTTKNTARKSTPGASSRYGVRPRCRWNRLNPRLRVRCRLEDARAWPVRPSRLPRDQVLPLLEVLLVVERLAVEDLDLAERLGAREDERVVRDSRVELLRVHTGALHRRDVVDPGDVLLRVAGLHRALHLRVVDVVHVDRRR